MSNSLAGRSVPTFEEVAKDGFGHFADTWYVGRPSIEEADELVRYELEGIEALDRAGVDASEFELFTLALEDGETATLSESQLRTFATAGLQDLAPAPDDAVLLGGLEIGVAGLVYALAAGGCPTAASCRSHAHDRSWANYPTVFFGWPEDVLSTLGLLASRADCGLREAEGLVEAYAPSIWETNLLARYVLEEVGDPQREGVE